MFYSPVTMYSILEKRKYCVTIVQTKMKPKFCEKYLKPFFLQNSQEVGFEVEILGTNFAEIQKCLFEAENAILQNDIFPKFDTELELFISKWHSSFFF